MLKDVGATRNPRGANSDGMYLFPSGNSNVQMSSSPSSMQPQIFGDGTHGFHAPQHDFEFDWGRMELFGDLSNIFLDSQPVDYLSQI